MPELPEVETIRIGLSRLLPGKKVAAVDFDWDKSFPNTVKDTEAFLIGSAIMEVSRRAKVLLIKLSSGYSLVIHLKMTGQLVFISPGEQPTVTKHSKFSAVSSSSAEPGFGPELRFGAGHPNDSLIGVLPDKSTRVKLTFVGGSILFFNDQRKFGWMRLLPTAEVPNIDFFKKVGPEPLSTDVTWKVLSERLRTRPNTNIKATLLDQSVIAGIGNIYADESLWGAQINPETLVKDLSGTTIKKLYQVLIAVLKLSIEKGGSTDKNYVNVDGKKGSYLSFASVFRRDGQPCLRCGTNIIKIRVAGRGTHICPKCQRAR